MTLVENGLFISFLQNRRCKYLLSAELTVRNVNYVPMFLSIDLNP